MLPLNELFEVEYGNKLDLNKLTSLPRSKGGVSLVGRSQNNHGVSATVMPLREVRPYPSQFITVALGGTKLLSSFVQEFPFYTAQNVAVLKPREPMTIEQKIWMCICIRANRFRYGAFGREANRTLRTLKVPALDEFPAWAAQPVIHLKSHLLSDTLSAVEAFSDVSPTQLTSSDKILVKVSEIFEVVYGSNLELVRLTLDPDGINFVSRTARNNGISARVKRIADSEPTPGGVLTVAGGGSVLETFYQSEPFYSGRDLYYLRPLEPMTPEELLYYARVIRINQYRFSYGRQANRTLRDLLIPPRSCVPAWVYGACRRIVRHIEGHIL